MSLTFDELIRTALLDLASQAEPKDLSQPALAAAARHRRALLATGITAAALLIATGSIPAITAADSRPGTAPPAAPAPTGRTSPSPCATATAAPRASRPPCDHSGIAGATVIPPGGATEEPPSPRKAGPTRSTTTDDRPGNRPHPKPTKRPRR